MSEDNKRDNITRVQLGSREIIIVGTAHVSLESVKEVEDIIRAEKPDRVCIEIDQSRYASLTNKSAWKDLSIPQVLKQKKGFLMLANLVLSSFQKRLGLDLGIKPGEEMMRAIAVAQELGIPFSFCDREIQTTLKRAWSKTGFWGKNKMLAAMISSVFFTEKLTKEEIEKLKEKSALQNMLEELSRYMPSVKTVLIDERDQYLATKIFTSDGNRVVAVVGAGHMNGIVSWLESLQKGTSTTDLSGIESIPEKSLLSKAVPFLIPTVIVGIIATGFLMGGFKEGMNMLIIWCLFTGILSAVGAIAALSHPLTILAALVTAPMTTLNPFLAVGFITGLIEYKFKKPRVDDFEQIGDDVTSFRGFYKNRFIHILMVFFLSNMGATIGTFIAGVPMVARFFGNLF